MASWLVASLRHAVGIVGSRVHKTVQPPLLTRKSNLELKTGYITGGSASLVRFLMKRSAPLIALATAGLGPIRG